MKNALKKIIPWVQIDKKILKRHIISKKLLNMGFKNLSNMIVFSIYRKYSCYISAGASLDKTVIFPHPLGIVIGEGVSIGKSSIIYQNVTIGRKNRDDAEYPTIGDNVIIYANSVIAGNIKIGNNSVIGCNSVVLRDVKEGEKVYGIVK